MKNSRTCSDSAVDMGSSPWLRTKLECYTRRSRFERSRCLRLPTMQYVGGGRLNDSAARTTTTSSMPAVRTKSNSWSRTPHWSRRQRLAMCFAFACLTNGQIPNLINNVPPGHPKSPITAAFLASLGVDPSSRSDVVTNHFATAQRQPMVSDEQVGRRRAPQTTLSIRHVSEPSKVEHAVKLL